MLAYEFGLQLLLSSSKGKGFSMCRPEGGRRKQLCGDADNVAPIIAFPARYQHFVVVNTGVSSEFITKQNGGKMQMTRNDMLARSDNKEAGQALSNLCVDNRPTIIFF